MRPAVLRMTSKTAASSSTTTSPVIVSVAKLRWNPSVK
jgi:hypothetical protein